MIVEKRDLTATGDWFDIDWSSSYMATTSTATRSGRAMHGCTDANRATKYRSVLAS